MGSFEYMCVPIFGLGATTTRRLNRLGAQGWELVAMWAVWHYFKRPLAASADLGSDRMQGKGA